MASQNRRRARRARVETSAGGVFYRWLDDTPYILLIRDSYQHWGFPKGHLEAGETPDAAALREVAEETGLGHLVLGPELLSPPRATPSRSGRRGSPPASGCIWRRRCD